MKRKTMVFMLAAGAAALLAGLWFVLLRRWRDIAPPPRLPVAGLRTVVPERTVVVPTLDTPLEEGKNALWCASWQMAWERMKEDVANGPVRLEGDPAMAKRLNEAPSVAGQVGDEDSYAAAGFVKDGIKERIRREMAERFPGLERPDLEGAEDGAAAYAYLRASAKFTLPYPNLTDPLVFKGADGKSTRVKGFGFPEKARFGNWRERMQAKVLHSGYDRKTDSYPFVIDLCADSTPYQVLMAQVPRRTTLSATLAEIEACIAKGPSMGPRLHSWSVVLVPHLRFRLVHRFAELEGRKIINPTVVPLVLRRAEQRIDFRLDDLGATLETQARGEMPKGDDDYKGDSPFIILMRKRGEERPFFVLRIENDELLEPWE